jgi:Acetyltransferase (GNAT) domain
MKILQAPPSEWDRLVPAPCQAAGFADAMTRLGYRPLYLLDDNAGALALVRGWFPGVRRMTARANLFAPGRDGDFVARAVTALGRLGIPHVKVGDTMWGQHWEALPAGWPFPRTRVVQRHTFVLELGSSDAVLLKAMDGAERKIRKAEREGVTVRPVRTPDELKAFAQLSKVTSDRVRERSAYTDFPDSFFERIYSSMAPNAAQFYIGWYKDEPLAGCLFLNTPNTMLYYLGGSTRDRELTAKQAPAAVFWHAIREARRLGMSRFDLGGCTPTDDPADPRYGVYAFKKRWGGRLETFCNLEIVLSALPVYFQERVLSPLWDQLHPWYFRLGESARALAGR